MAKSVILLTYGQEKPSTPRIFSAMQSHFSNHLCKEIEFRIITVDGGFVTIIQDLPYDHMERFEDSIVKSAPIGLLKEKIMKDYPKAIYNEDEEIIFDIPAHVMAGLLWGKS